MYVRKTAEIHHSSDEQVAGYARGAVAIADELDLSAEDRAVLLPTIMAQLASKQVFMEQQQTGPVMAIPRNHG